MAAFGCTGVVLKENVKNPSFSNAMTNSSLTGLHCMQVGSHKQKRTSLPDILSTTAGHARRFLKRFSNSFVTSRSSRSLSPSESKANHVVSLSQKCSVDENRTLLLKDNISFNKKIEDNFDVLDNIGAVSNSSMNSLLPTKWSRQEYVNLSKKRGRPPKVRSLTHECLDLRSHFHSSRKLKYDQNSDDICAKKKRLEENDVDGFVAMGEKHLPSHKTSGVNIATLTTSKHSLSMTWSTSGTSSIVTSQQQIEHIACHVQTVFSTIETNETSFSSFKTPVENASNSPKNCGDWETSAFKTIGSLVDGNGNLENNSQAAVQGALCSPTKLLQTNFQEKCISSNTKIDSVLDIKPRSLKTKVTRSLLFLPYPKMPFKVKAVQPMNVPFEVVYSPSTMIPIVRTTGEVFEAHLQEIIIDAKGQERFHNSPSKFSCTIRVKACEAAEKFDEIKEALRVVSSSYNIDRQDCIKTSAQISIKSRNNSLDKKVEPHSFEGNYSCRPLPHVSTICRPTKKLYKSTVMQSGLKESTVDLEGTPFNVPVNNDEKEKSDSKVGVDLKSKFDSEVTDSNSDTDGSQAPLRRSCRKVKEKGLWEGRNAYATKITRAASPQVTQERQNLGNVAIDFIDDKTYLDRTFIVNQFVQDITGVPVVVLERLSRDKIEKILKR